MFPSRFTTGYSYSIHTDSSGNVYEHGTRSTGPFSSTRSPEIANGFNSSRIHIDTQHRPAAGERVRIRPRPASNRRPSFPQHQPHSTLPPRAATWVSTHTDFLSHNDASPPPNTECPVCLEPCEAHLCYKIINVPGCTHMIGIECLEAFLRNRPDDKKECPLCRTQWLPQLGVWQDEALAVDLDPGRHMRNGLASRRAPHPLTGDLGVRQNASSFEDQMHDLQRLQEAAHRRLAALSLDTPFESALRVSSPFVQLPPAPFMPPLFPTHARVPPLFPQDAERRRRLLSRAPYAWAERSSRNPNNAFYNPNLFHGMRWSNHRPNGPFGTGGSLGREQRPPWR